MTFDINNQRSLLFKKHKIILDYNLACVPSQYGAFLECLQPHK